MALMTKSHLGIRTATAYISKTIKKSFAKNQTEIYVKKSKTVD